MSAALRMPPVLGPVSGDGIARAIAGEFFEVPAVNIWEMVRDG